MTLSSSGKHKQLDVQRIDERTVNRKVTPAKLMVKGVVLESAHSKVMWAPGLL